MSRELVLQNEQWVKKIDLRLLRKITGCLLEELLGNEEFELGIHLVAAKKMAEVNEQFLQHTGSTDVITFDYSGASSPALPGRNERFILHGEIFISIDDAIKQAKEFRTTWQSELTRYVVHGVLHLEGYDDLEPVARKKMKREENRLLKELSRSFSLAKLAR